MGFKFSGGIAKMIQSAATGSGSEAAVPRTAVKAMTAAATKKKRGGGYGAGMADMIRDKAYLMRSKY